eukprot:scaffold7419_cov137-Isochrysis_galbana.AAC.3
MHQPRNLRAQVVLLHAREGRVAADFCAQISSEEFAHKTRSHNCPRRHVGQLDPWRCWIVCDEVGARVAARAVLLRRNRGRWRVWVRLWLFRRVDVLRLGQVVVLAGSENLAEEADGRELLGQLQLAK